MKWSLKLILPLARTILPMLTFKSGPAGVAGGVAGGVAADCAADSAAACVADSAAGAGVALAGLSLLGAGAAAALSGALPAAESGCGFAPDVASNSCRFNLPSALMMSRE